MSDVDGPTLTYAVLCLVLVGSALLSRRIPMGQAAKMAAAWVGIFALGFLLFSFRSEFSAVGSRLKGELLGTPIVNGTEVRIPIGEDGHFWTTASINGREARFLVDSGATSTTISGDFATQLGISGDGSRMPVSTANGTVAMDMARVGELRLGDIERKDMRVMINGEDTTNVLGMNFLSSLTSWRVEGHHLVLQP